MLNDEALNATEVAEILHIGRNAVYALAKSGELPSYKIGRKLFFGLKDVQAYIAGTRSGGIPEAAGTSNISVANTSTEGLAADPCADFSPIQRSTDGFIIAGHGIAADLFVERLEMMGNSATRTSRESYTGLMDIYSGNADAALIHLYDQRTNTYNIPFVQRLAPGTPVIVFRLMKRWQGFAVAKGNPKGIRSWGSLLGEGISVANRRRGCGSRILLDEKLIAMEAIPQNVPGYDMEFSTGMAAAEAVVGGAFDVAVIEEHIAAHVDGIDFIKMQPEWLDIVVSKKGHGRQLGHHLREMLADAKFKREYERIVHGEAEGFGSIVYEC